MRALGIDFGERRIGLAISDPAGRIAMPLATFVRQSDQAAVDHIAGIAREEGVERLVLGEPVGLDGARGAAAERVRRFALRLETATGLPLELVGEALTTVEAAERLRAAGLDPRKHPEKLDQIAAQVLLEEFLGAVEG